MSDTRTCLCDDRSAYNQRIVRALLSRSGFFRWGAAWIHESDEGTVMDEAEALELALNDPSHRGTA